LIRKDLLVKIARTMSLMMALAGLLCSGADWTRFRGPDACGVAEEAEVPATWSGEEHVVWKTRLPGAGASSPITLGDRVYLTSYSGYGVDPDDPGDPANLQQNMMCFSLADGKLMWGKGTKARLPEKEYDVGFIELHGYASSTPTTDGDRVYAFFGRSGALAYTVDGEPVWRAYVGDGTHHWGSAASPVLYDKLLIVNASVESESLVALDKTTGQEVWRVPGIEESWSTPLIVEIPGGSKELVVSMKGKVLGLDPATGEELWQCAGVDDYVVPAVIAHEGIVYVTGGRKPQTLAIRAGGRGDVTDTHLLWESNRATKVPTPIYHEGHLYWVGNKGMAVCLNAEDGEVLYRERLRDLDGAPDKVYASPVLVGDKLFCVTRESGTLVLATGPDFELLAQNDLGDASLFNATAVPAGNRLLIRSDRYLYCIGK
jgi:hypothetical protein